MGAPDRIWLIKNGTTEPREPITFPAFFTIAGIPLTFSIAAGIGLGVLGYVLVMVASGRARAVHPLMWAIAPFFVAFFAADWLSANVC